MLDGVTMVGCSEVERGRFVLLGELEMESICSSERKGTLDFGVYFIDLYSL